MSRVMFVRRRRDGFLDPAFPFDLIGAHAFAYKTSRENGRPHSEFAQCGCPNRARLTAVGGRERVPARFVKLVLKDAHPSR
jgi:hypothetical protein